MAAENASQTADNIAFVKVTVAHPFPAWASRKKVERFLFEKMQPFNDKPGDITRGVDYALSEHGEPGGFIMLAASGDQLVGVLVMIRTGMHGFIPDNVLLYVGVDPELRGQGIGGKLVRHSIEEADGDVKLHVEFDNPAKRLYERLGFTSKYAEMRYVK